MYLSTSLPLGSWHMLIHHQILMPNVNPQIVEQYDGKTIKLGDTGRVLSQETFPELKTYRSYANDY